MPKTIRSRNIMKKNQYLDILGQKMLLLKKSLKKNIREKKCQNKKTPLPKI